MEIIKNLSILGFFIFIYLIFASRFHHYFPRSAFDYYNYLSFSFLNKKTWLLKIPAKAPVDYSIYKAPLDLSIYKNKLYLCC